ncbi:MAG: adenosylmethionine decarboxylase [Pseudomonadota bacterium]
MAYDDTLFQLGMDLTRSSTAQKEEHRATKQASPAETIEKESSVSFHPSSGSSSTETAKCGSELDDRKDFFIERDGVRYAGNHLIIDLFGATGVDDVDRMEQAMRTCIDEAGATLLHFHLHEFTPNGGVSGVAVLSESHISVHSWPEANYAAFDVFMCGDARPEVCVDILKNAFDADEVVVKTHRRGEDLDLDQWQAAAKEAKAA